jgi:hypothetical protein
MRGGWKFNTVKRGDKVSAVVSPLRNGDPGCLLNRIALPDGRVLSNGGGPPARERRRRASRLVSAVVALVAMAQLVVVA